MESKYNYNWTGKIAGLFVRNGRLSLLLLITLFIWGTISFFNTPKQYNPEITAPAFQIRVDFPGASRSEILEQVTKPLENVVANIPEVEDIFSVTTRGGSAVVNVNYFVGSDMDQARIELNDRIQSNLNLAPLGTAPVSIRTIDPEDVPVLTLLLKSEKRSPVELRKFAFKLRDRLNLVPGVSRIDILGGRKRELAVAVDPLRLARRGVSLPEIENALAVNNYFRVAGRLKNDKSEIYLESVGLVKKKKDLEELVVVTGDVGQVQLKDVATVLEKTAEREAYIHHSRKSEKGSVLIEDPVLLSVAKLKGTNITNVTDSLQETLKGLENGFIPKDVQARVLANEGDTAAKEINRLISNLLTAILIVVVILVFFLDLRAALLVAISIPLTLASVFGSGLLADQNINRITLFALILSLGLLVDNAAVVIENIVRLLRDKSMQDRTREEIVIYAVHEVGPGLFMSTVTTVLAFLPMAFIGGMMGPYMGPIPFFVPAALILALLISYSVNPWMASVLLQKGTDRKTPPAWTRRFTQLNQKAGDFIMNGYRRILSALLHNRKKRNISLLGILTLLLLSFALPGLAWVKFRMLPKADREQFFLYVDLPAGSSLLETRRITGLLEKELLKFEDVRMLQSYVGRPPVLDFNGLFRGVSARQESHLATIRVGLSEPETRSVKSATLVAEYRKRILTARKNFDPAGGVRLKFVEDPPGPPVLSTFLVRVQGYDEDLLIKTARDLLPRVNKIEGMTDTDISDPAPHETIHLEIDHKRASQSRISSRQISESLRTLYAGRIIGIYHNRTNREQEFISLRLDRRLRKNKKALKQIQLFNDRGIGVPLTRLIKIKKQQADKPLRRENRLHTVYVYGDMTGRSITYSAIDFLFLLGDYTLPGSKSELVRMNLMEAVYRNAEGKEVTISVGGEWELTLEVFRDLGIAMGVAIFLVYFVLVAQFGSFREPIVIMSTIPLSLIGVLPGFLVLGAATGLYFNATSMIGVIALAGIAVNNSIILLEYLKGLRNKGLTLEEALVQAGVTRFRPIMLTTITTMLGSLTIVGDPVWAGLAFAVILGLGVSSLLTLLVFPSLYQMMKGKQWQM